MYPFLLKFVRPSWAKLLIALWYAALMFAILLTSNHAGKGDFLYLHL
ncbi:hypothetical protein KJ877_08800 [bacterium]|nr:hypothetical protein [bacterium]MBU1990795.1 hypothetical protein [bacterium]